MGGATLNKCGETNGLSQKRPQEGRLFDNTDLTRNALKDRLRNEGGDLYSYVVKTVRRSNDSFVQKGTGPNFEGGLITLCTCKHLMRTWYQKEKGISDWEGRWIAGLTSVTLSENKENYLFYLMKIAKAFPSHRILWNYLNSNAQAASVKDATQNPCGDIYRPKPTITREFEPSDYSPPHKNHYHSGKEQWHKDIRYSPYGKPPALLLGDVDHSYLWFMPSIRFKGRHSRASTKWKMQCFIKSKLI